MPADLTPAQALDEIVTLVREAGGRKHGWILRDDLRAILARVTPSETCDAIEVSAGRATDDRERITVKARQRQTPRMSASDTTPSAVPGAGEVEHRIQSGTHENMYQPRCTCGARWDRTRNRCAAITALRDGEVGGE